MKTHLRSMAKRKVSDFLLREEGMVGNRSAFATAALVSTASLATTLLVVPDAEACPCGDIECEWNKKCCKLFVNQVWHYWCIDPLNECA